MANQSILPSLCVVVPVSERHDHLERLHHSYRASVDRISPAAKFIYVVDGDFGEAIAQLKRVAALDSRVSVIQLARWFGEAAALSAGFDRCDSEYIMTLPAYAQVQEGQFSGLAQGITHADMVVGRRSPRSDSWINRLQGGIFKRLVRWLTGESFEDLGCSVRLMSRRILDDVRVYGDQHRFLPIMARRQGYKVLELPLTQHEQDRHRRIYSPGIYIRRILDLLTIVFLGTFTRKPLRFFGLIGASSLMLGFLALLWVMGERLFFGIALADRPALLLSTVMIVLGVQIIALGLIGELMIFVHASSLRDYRVDTIIDWRSVAGEDEKLRAQDAVSS